MARVEDVDDLDYPLIVIRRREYWCGSVRVGSQGTFIHGEIRTWKIRRAVVVRKGTVALPETLFGQSLVL